MINHLPSHEGPFEKFRMVVLTNLRQSAFLYSLPLNKLTTKTVIDKVKKPAEM